MFEKLMDSWSEKEIFQIQANVISEILVADTDQKLETATEFARFANFKKLDIDNYPFFLEMLLHDKVEVIDALMGDDVSGAPLDVFTTLQRNKEIVHGCFQVLKRLQMDSYEKGLDALFRVLYLAYHKPEKGWVLYPPSIAELNWLGKYLDKSKAQDDRINRIVLDILGDIGELSSQKNIDEQKDKIGAHANKIRNIFFDNRNVMDQVIPPILRD